MDWLDQLVYDLKGEVPGLGLSLDVTWDGYLVIGYVRVPIGDRRGLHGPRIARRILAEADARGLGVLCTPTDAYGSDRRRLMVALTRAGFVPVDGHPTGHTMLRPAAHEPARTGSGE